MKIIFKAVRSRGPGGQNVNKVSSAAQMICEFEDSPNYTIEQKERIREKLKSYIDKQGRLHLRSDEFRDLQQNKDRCLEKLHRLLGQALHQPKPRKPTKPTAAAREKRLKFKSARSESKRLRGKVSY